MSDLVGQKIGARYLLQRKLGEGGMASVYLAIDEKLKRPVAVKVLLGHMEKNPEVRLRFQQEAQAISGLDHPNIVKIFDYSGADSANLWFVTEVIRGQNLAEIASKQPQRRLHPIIASCVIRETAKALTHAHSLGIIHRDIKPENIMVTYDGVLKLMDFGIAKINQNQSVTTTGAFMGSPSYMSPEQIRGRLIDHRSDLYSLSVVFYEILTGRLPFTGGSTHDVILRISEGRYTHPIFINEEIPDLLNGFVIRGLSRSLDERFSSALEMEKILQDFLLSANYDESHVELQRYFRDPDLYQSQVLSRKTKPLISTIHLTQAKSRDKTAQLAATQVLPTQPTLIKPAEIQPQAKTEIIAEPQTALKVVGASETKVAPQVQKEGQKAAQEAPGSNSPRENTPQQEQKIALQHYHILVDKTESRGFGAFIFGLGIVACLLAAGWISYEVFLKPQKIAQQQPVPTAAPTATPTIAPTPVESTAPTATPSPVQPSPTRHEPTTQGKVKPPKKSPATKPGKPSPAPTKKAEKSKKPQPTVGPIAPTLVRVSSTPAAEIFYRGRKIGTTIDAGSSSQPLIIDQQPFEIELRRAGFLSQKIKIEASKSLNGSMLGPFVLKRDTFERETSGDGILVALSPKQDLWLNIDALEGNFRDKRYIGAAPTSIKLKYGRYRLTFETKAGVKKSRVIQISASQEKLQIDLTGWIDSP